MNTNQSEGAGPHLAAILDAEQQNPFGKPIAAILQSYRVQALPFDADDHIICKVADQSARFCGRIVVAFGYGDEAMIRTRRACYDRSIAPPLFNPL